jgi:hypothetical protein
MTTTSLDPMPSTVFLLGRSATAGPALARNPGLAPIIRQPRAQERELVANLLSALTVQVLGESWTRNNSLVTAGLWTRPVA